MSGLNFFINKSIEKIAHNFFNRIKIGELVVTFPYGNKYVYSGALNGLHAEIKLNNFSLIYKIFKKKSLGFAESYMDGDFHSKNLSNLLVLAQQNEEFFLSKIETNICYSLISKLKHYLKENTVSKSKKNISYHYDLGNDFYKLWLDESMTYSSGLFDSSYKDLAKAQNKKFQEIIELLKLNEKSSLLEIGCGWGGFSRFVAKNYGTQINAITISKSQYDYAVRKNHLEGLNEKIKVHLKDYREINTQYDNIVSIEMFEAVGKKYWPVFFEKVKNSLKNNGNAVMQVITIDDKRASFYQNNPDFIQQYIFPGGVLPSKNQLYQITSSIGLKFNEYKSFGKSYAETLRLWNNKFQKSWAEISQQGFSKRFKRMWEFYFAYCEAGFTLGSTDVSQFTIKK